MIKSDEIWSKMIESDRMYRSEVVKYVVGNGLELVGNILWFELTSQIAMVYYDVNCPGQGSTAGPIWSKIFKLC